MLRNFEKFEVGHYYVYTGERINNWSYVMDAVLERKIYKCLNSSLSNRTDVMFEGVEWVEVESPDAVFEIGDSVLEYNQHYKHWKKVVIGACNLTEYKQENDYDNGSFVYYICKRKPKEKDDIMSMPFVFMNERLKCPHCGGDKERRASYEMYFECIGKNFKDKCFHCGKQYRYDRASQQLNLISDEHVEGVKALSKMLGVDNPFKKYIRKKKYLTFSKEKKHTN